LSGPFDYPDNPEALDAIGRLERRGAAIGPRDEQWIHVELVPPYEGNPIVDADVAQIVDDVNLIGNVWCLDLTETPITDAAMPQLGRLQCVRALHLYGTLITDNGLPFLISIPHLEDLSIGLTQTTDAALPVLSRFRFLQKLDIGHTGISLAGARRLEDTMKHVEMWFGEGFVE
jgi:hypothetical protein